MSQTYKSPLDASNAYLRNRSTITFKKEDIDASFPLSGHQLSLLAEIQQRPINPTVRDKGPRSDDLATRKTLETLIEFGLVESRRGVYVLSRHALSGEYILASENTPHTQKQPF